MQNPNFVFDKKKKKHELQKNLSSKHDFGKKYDKKIYYQTDPEKNCTLSLRRLR